MAGILLSWTGGEWGISLGVLGILGACFLWGVDNNLTRQISGKNPLIITGIKGLGAGSFSLLLSVVLGQTFPALRASISAMLVGSISYGLSIQLFILALRGLGAARTGALFGIAPFVGAGLSLLFLGDKPHFLFWLALPVMLVGAWLMLTENHQHQHIHERLAHDHAHNHSEDHHTHKHALSEQTFIHEIHTHQHWHDKMVHAHPHTPDHHHRHMHHK